MIEKRFTLLDETIIDNEEAVDDGGKQIYWTVEYVQRVKLVELLNELHDEKQSVIKWIDNKIEEIKPYNSELCRATLLELKEFLE